MKDMSSRVLAFSMGVIQAAPGENEGGVALHLLLLNPDGTEQKKFIQYVNSAFWNLNDACKLQIAKSEETYQTFVGKRVAIQEENDLDVLLSHFPSDSPYSIHTYKRSEVPMVKMYCNDLQPDAFVVDRTFSVYSNCMLFTVRFVDQNTISFSIANDLVFTISEILDQILDLTKWQCRATTIAH